MQDATELWQAVKRGIPTNVLLNTLHEYESQQYGLELTFQDATRNLTHACVKSKDPNQKLCIDVESPRCEDVGKSETLRGRVDDSSKGGESRRLDKQHSNPENNRRRLGDETAKCTKAGSFECIQHTTVSILFVSE